MWFILQVTKLIFAALLKLNNFCSFISLCLLEKKIIIYMYAIPNVTHRKPDSLFIVLLWPDPPIYTTPDVVYSETSLNGHPSTADTFTITDSFKSPKRFSIDIRNPLNSGHWARYSV